MNKQVFAGVRLICQALTNHELVAMNLSIHAGWDISTRPWYEKVSALFTENGKTEMHPEVLNAFHIVVTQRLNEE